MFLSYNRKDQSAVVVLAEKLRASGLNVWLDIWELRPGHPWQEDLEKIIETTGAAAVLVGMDGLGPWQDQEMRGCLSEFVRRGLPVIPVLLPGCPVKPKLPFFLKQFTWVDFRNGLAEQGFHLLIWGITGKKPREYHKWEHAKPSKKRLFSWLMKAGLGLMGVLLMGGLLYVWFQINPLAPLPEPDMVHLPGGTFLIGSEKDKDPDAEEDEQPRQVIIGPFSIGKYEVTQSQWKRIMRNNPSHFSQCGDDCPVENVSYKDVQRFIETLNRQTGKRYRLPTEAEWEYACRSGGETQKYCGGGDVDALGWHGDNSEGKTHPVGSKAPNGLGLYDLSGNVWEWSCSSYVERYNGTEIKCADSGERRVIRGGSWGVKSARLRSAIRDWLKLDDRYSSLGFRLALD